MNSNKLIMLAALTSMSVSSLASNYVIHQVANIKSPSIQFSNVEKKIRFSAKDNDADGICRSLGFSSGLPGSVTESSYYGQSLITESNGEIKSVASNNYFVSEVTCLDYLGIPPVELKFYSSPGYPGSVLRFSGEENNVDHICSLLGNDRGLGFMESSYYGRSIVVDERGNMRIEKSDYYMKNLVCLDNDGFSRAPVYSSSSVNGPDQALGFNFKRRALKIADVVINVTRALEPYQNNSEEQLTDDIKKQAIRLRTRINGGRDLNLVRNTLFHLEALLSDTQPLFDKYLESDNLDRLGEGLMTARESIITMVDFIDTDFDGKRSDLY